MKKISAVRVVCSRGRKPTVGDPRRAKELLGFEARTTLEDGAQKLIEWRKEALKKNGN